MPGEIALPYDRTGRAVYALLRDATARVYWPAQHAFEAYQTGQREVYAIALAEQGTASRYYAADMPADVPAGVYSLAAHDHGPSGSAGVPAEGDPTVGTEQAVYWDGAAIVPLTGLADKLLSRNLAGGIDGGRTVREALRASRNRVALDVPAEGQFTVFAEDDEQVAWVGVYNRGPNILGPLTSVDPA